MTINVNKFRSYCTEFDQTIKVSVADTKSSSLLDPRPWPEGSYKIGSNRPSVRPSVSP